MLLDILEPKGASFSSPTLGTYTNSWLIRKIDVRNSCEIKEKTPCTGRDCDKANKSDTTLSYNAEHLDSSSKEILRATKTKVDYNFATNPNSITNAKTTINKYENKDTNATEGHETYKKGGATSENTRLWPYILMIILIPTFNVQ